MGSFVSKFTAGAYQLGANGGTSPSFDSSAAQHLFLVQTCYAGSTEPVPSDNQGNTWIPLTVIATTNDRIRIYYCLNATVSASHTITSSQTASFPTIIVRGYTATSPSFVAENKANNTLGTTVQTGSVSPSGTNDLFITGICSNALGTFSIDTGFSIDAQQNYSGGLAFGTGEASKLSSSAENPTWTDSGAATELAAVIACFTSTGGVVANVPYDLQHSPGFQAMMAM